ncbi:uncharacterized protein [Chiloscyllium punctatum]|uniref:uncharacterized protein n=1 Tax=Chiloscyllium punctatum TaxID=137246 RepID=UPI003B63E9F8
MLAAGLQQFSCAPAQGSGRCVKEGADVPPPLLRGRVLFQDFGEMQLPSFPPAVFQLQHLEELHLEGNLIEEIPPQIGRLRRLRVLYLNGNRLQQVCEELGELQRLQSLDLSDNPLNCSALTETLCRLRQLRELRLYHTNLKQLPGQLCKKLRHLQLLGLSGNKLESLPWEIRSLSELQQLYLQCNNLQVLPVGFCQLHHLEVLDLRDNGMISLPDDINCLQNLKHLYLADNNLGFIPQTLSSCSSLCVLDISRNSLDPHYLCPLPGSLAELDLSGNRLHTVPAVVCKLGAALQLLYLKNTHIKSLSCCFSQLTGLRLLDLSQNVLRYFPKQICSLGHLEVLSLDDSKLKEVAPGIKNLSKLKTLGLTGNRFRAFPQEICFVKSLEKLYLGQDHGMKFIHIPEEISQLVNLRELYLENNEIEFLPSTTGLLRNLVVLDCHENRLLELPQSIVDIPGLKHLLASCNRIRHLPTNFDKLKNLEIVSLERNPLEKPLDEICHKGVSAIFQYFEKLKTQNLKATKIQAWWRGQMVRKELGPFKNLFPKKDKKGKKDKGKEEKGKQQKEKKK